MTQDGSRPPGSSGLTPGSLCRRAGRASGQQGAGDLATELLRRIGLASDGDHVDLLEPISGPEPIWRILRRALPEAARNWRATERTNSSGDEGS